MLLVLTTVTDESKQPNAESHSAKLTLRGAHRGEGSRRQQAHLAQLHGVLPVQRLAFGWRGRRTLV